MRYSFLAIIALTLLGANTATAATVITDDSGSATNILGLDIDGAELAYNVEFVINFWDATEVYGGPPPELDTTSEAFAAAATDAINSILTAEGVTAVAEAGDSRDIGIYAIGYDYVAAEDLNIVVWLGGAHSERENVWFNDIENNPVGGGQTRAQAFMWAKLTVVPVPPAIWLFGSALGLLGWARRRTGS